MGRPILGKHLVAVSVIGRYEGEPALGRIASTTLLNAGINRFDGGDGGRNDARVAHHIGIREVHDVHIGLIGIDRRSQIARATSGSLISLQIVGCWG